MTLAKLPLIDAYETTLSQEWDWTIGTIYVNTTPDFTFPSGVTTYIVVDPDNSRIQAAEINAYNATTGTLTCNSITVEKWAWVNYSATVHPIGAKVRISTSYQFWKDIKTDLDGKLDNDGGNSSTTFDLDLTGSNFRIRKDWNDMKFTDDNQAEISLSALASASWVNDKVKISATDTTEWYLNTKLTAWDGLNKTVIDPAGNETLDLDIDLTDTAIFTATQGNAWKALKLDWSGNIDTSFDASTTRKWLLRQATSAEDLARTNTTTAISPAQRWLNVNLLTGTLTTTSSVTIAHWLGTPPRLIMVQVNNTNTSANTYTATWDATYDWTTIKQKVRDLDQKTVYYDWIVRIWDYDWSINDPIEFNMWAISAIDATNITLAYTANWNNSIGTPLYVMTVIA